MKKKKNNALIIFVDKEKKRAIAYEGDKNKIEAEISGERHPKYRWKNVEIEINRDEGSIEFDKDDIEERKKMIKQIAKKLKNQVNIEEFLIDKLEDQNMENIKDIYERLTKHKVKITNKEGCFYLNIGGKKGKPKRLQLSD